MSYEIQIPMTQLASSQNDQEDVELKRLRFQNETYREYKGRWEFYLSAYQGGEDFANGNNLFRYCRETLEDFTERCKRVHNLNYLEPLVGFFTNFIFADSITRRGNTNEKWYLNFIKNVNKRGDDIDKFMRQVSTDAQVFGMIYILADSPTLPTTSDDPEAVQPIITRQYEIDNGIQPYWVSIKPDEILDWTLDDFGKLMYVKRMQLVTEASPRGRFAFEKYTEYYPGQAVVTQVDVTDATKPTVLAPTTFTTTLTDIPMVVARYKRGKLHPH